MGFCLSAKNKEHNQPSKSVPNPYKNKKLSQKELEDVIEITKFEALEMYFQELQIEVIMTLNPMSQHQFAHLLSTKRTKCLEKFKEQLKKATIGTEVPQQKIQLTCWAIEKACIQSDSYYIFYNNLHSYEEINSLKKTLIQEGLIKNKFSEKQLLKQYDKKAAGSFVKSGREELRALIQKYQISSDNKKSIVRDMLMEQTIKQRQIMETLGKEAAEARKTLVMANPHSKVFKGGQIQDEMNEPKQIREEQYGIRELEHSFIQDELSADQNKRIIIGKNLFGTGALIGDQPAAYQKKKKEHLCQEIEQIQKKPKVVASENYGPQPSIPQKQLLPPLPVQINKVPPSKKQFQTQPTPIRLETEPQAIQEAQQQQNPQSPHDSMTKEQKNLLKSRQKIPEDQQEKLQEEMKKTQEKIYTPQGKIIVPKAPPNKKKSYSSSSSSYSD